MFDKALDKAFGSFVPKQLDLGNFDKAVSWLRDSAFACYSMGMSASTLRSLLNGWLDFIGECDDLFDYHDFALHAYAAVIFQDLTDLPFNFPISEVV